MGAFPQIADWNEDGKNDLLVGDTNGNITLFTNTGTNINPVLAKSGFIQAGGKTLDVGSRATPVVVDWNNDGKKDLLSGNSSGNILLYLNVGSNAAPVFNTSTYLTAGGSTIIHFESCCEVCDLDMDGKKDLLVGDYTGNIYFYSNTGTDADPAFSSGVLLQAGSSNLDVSYYARFDAVDWDEDGDRDLVVGEWDANVYLFLNTSGAAGRITVISPNGGEIWYAGNSMDIQWNSQGNSGHIKIELSRNGGSTWEMLFASTPDDGKQSWVVTGPASTNCKVRISDVDGNPSDVSDGVFTIKEPQLIIVSPNGGETWRVGTTQTITWTSEGTSGQVRIELSRSGSSTWETLVATTPDDQTQAWSVTSPAATNCLIKISDVDGAPVDLSDATFAIRLQPEWSTPITIGGGNVKLIRTFGGDASATDGYDASLDVPLTPSATGYDAYFEVGSSPAWLDTDIRQWAPPYSREISWTLKITNATGITSTLSWNAATLPSVGNFTLIGLAADVDLRTQTSASVLGNATLTIKYCAGVTFNFPKQGWYLISLPLTPNNSNLSVLFPTAIAAYAYNSALGSYEAVTALDPRKGYWLLIPAATSVTIAGTSVAGFTQYYTTGWHLIGSVAGGADFTDPQDNPNGAILAAHGYDPNTGNYFQIYPPGAGRLEERQGYWLAVLQPCYLTIGRGTAGDAFVLQTASQAAFAREFGALPPTPPATTELMLQTGSASTQLSARCYPNPFNAVTFIEYLLPCAGSTHVHIYNVRGQCIRTLVEQQQGPGKQAIAWDGTNDNLQPVVNGIYFYRIEHSGQVRTEKVMLLK